MNSRGLVEQVLKGDVAPVVVLKVGHGKDALINNRQRENTQKRKFSPRQVAARGGVKVWRRRGHGLQLLIQQRLPGVVRCSRPLVCSLFFPPSLFSKQSSNRTSATHLPLCLLSCVSSENVLRMLLFSFCPRQRLLFRFLRVSLLFFLLLPPFFAFPSVFGTSRRPGPPRRSFCVARGRTHPKKLR